MCWTEPDTHVQLNEPQKGDEEQVECHKETEGAADIRDGLALCRWYKQVWGREGHRRGVGRIQRGDGRQTAPEVPIVFTRHSCSETGNTPCSRRHNYGAMCWLNEHHCLILNKTLVSKKEKCNNTLYSVVDNPKCLVRCHDEKMTQESVSPFILCALSSLCAAGSWCRIWSYRSLIFLDN